MASSNKKFREIISGSESVLNRIISKEEAIQDMKQELQDKIDFYCSCECYFFDCGLFCPDECPVHSLYHSLKELQEQKENDVLKELGLTK